MDDKTSEILLMMAFIVHAWLVVRFCIQHTFGKNETTRPYHLKWLMLIFFLPFVGYLLYRWLTRHYVAEER